MTIYKYIILLLIISSISACDLDRLNLEQEYLPNYSLTLDSKNISKSTSSDLIALSESEYLLAIESELSKIELIKYSQQTEYNTWQLEEETVFDVGNGNIYFFDTVPSGYLIGYTDLSNKFNIKFIDLSFSEIVSQSNYETYIDTTYNNIDSLYFENFDLDPISNEIILGGKVSTQGTNYSCLLKIDTDLNPIWFKTYFENSTISNLAVINQDSFYILNNHTDGTDLIIDNTEGTAYKKYNLSNDQLFFGIQSFVQDESLFLAGIINDIARTIEINLESESAFVNDIEIYPVSDFKTLYLSRDNIVTAGIQVEGSEQQLFSSELESFGSQWCNRYPNENFIKVLDLIELPERGILISSIVERQGRYHINLTRIDEEGATVINEYSENCI